MNFKRITIFGMMAFGAFSTAFSIPADPAPKKVKQPDGSYITVMMRGDERAHLMTTTDGLPLYYNNSSKAFEYASLSGTALTGSGIIASDEGKRSAQEAEYISKMDVNAMTKAAAGKSNALRKASSPQKILINNFPTKGRQKTLVILFSFSDKDFTSIEDPKQFYHDMLNKEGFTHSNGANGSARDFYMASSMGQFDPEFVVAGPVKLSKSQTYYGSDNGGQDAKMGEAVVEACRAVDDEIDFSEFDTDNDGSVDNIYFFYAGGGQADDPNGTDYIWPHSADLTEAWNMTLELDGKRIGQYACSNELRYSSTGELIPTGIGTFVHEFGHVLGLADHYDTSYGLLTFGLGTWDTMASGSYNNNMHTPPVFSAFERAELGWLDYTDLDNNADSITKIPILADKNKAFRVKVPGNDNEYFVLENRQKQGWDQYLPGHGMLVWHIDMDEEAWMNNRVNVDPSHQRIDIVEADGTATEATRSGDIFPGTSGITQYDLKSWAGEDLVSFDDVTETADDVRLLLKNTAFVLPSPADITFTEVEDSSFTVTWSGVENAKGYTLSIYTTAEGGEKQYLQGFNSKQYQGVDVLTIDRLVPNTEYTVEVSASLGSYTSAVTTGKVQTLDLIFEKRKPEGLAVSDVTSSGFTASWDAVRDANDYLVTLYKHDYAAETNDKGYDFTDRYDGMPELWNTSSTLYYSVSGYYGASAPSLRLSSNDDYLIVAYPESKIASLQFWCRASRTGATLHVEKDEDGVWTEIQTVNVGTTADTKTVDTGDASRLRLRLERESGYVVLDDVVASCHSIERTPVTGYDAVSTDGNQSFVFSNLTSGGTYSFRVTGLLNGSRSYTSDECSLVLPNATGIDAVQAGDSAPVSVYDLSGRKLTDGSSRSGVFIVKKGGKAFKVVK